MLVRSESHVALRGAIDVGGAPVQPVESERRSDRDQNRCQHRCEDAEGLEHARRRGIPTFTCAVAEHPDRAAWDRALAAELGAFGPDLVVSAGFMKLVGPAVLEAFGGRLINTHPALLPAFPGAHAVRDALAAGVSVTGATVHVVDAGVDTGPVLTQRQVPVLPGDDEARLHERIKAVERELLVQTVAELVTASTRENRR